MMANLGIPFHFFLAILQSRLFMRSKPEPSTVGASSTWLTRIESNLLFCVVASTLFVGPAFAQGDMQPTQSTANRILEAPVPGDLSKDNRVFSPSRIFGKQPVGGVGFDLREKAASVPSPQMKLSTTVETKIENKTTNYVGSGGAPVGEAHEPSSPARPPAPVFGFEFADFVRQSLGTPLSVFGADLFADASRSHSIDPLTVPADYRIGPGDELLIRAWGQIDIDFQGQVDRSGNIFLPKIGQVMVAGMPVKDLADHLRITIQKQFKNFELTATLGSLRQIQYYVMGFVKQPGVYAAASTSSALHGLMTAGGVLPYADLRNIELRRGGVVIAHIDAYRFLIDGDRSNDPQLLPGDVIYVPTGKAFAGVAGGVRRAAIYHLKPDTTLNDLLKASGGLSFSEAKPSLRVERVESGRRVIEHLTYDANMGQRLVRDGELYMVLPVSPRIVNAVTLRGHVAAPMRQAWVPGMKVSDLLGSRDNLVRLANWVQKNERETLSKLGGAGRDNDFKRDFPDVEWDYAAIERIDPIALAASIKTFSLIKALDKDPTEDLLLQPGDTVVVFARSDFRQPQIKKLKMVRMEGEVKVPGVYPVESGETLTQALARAGGLTDQAYVFGTVFTRLSARRSEEERLRQAADRVEQDYLRYLAGRARNSVSQEDASVSSSEMEAVRSLISRLRAVQAVGRIPLGMPSSKHTQAAYPGLTLEDDDAIFIPHRPSTVTIVGAVFQEGSLLWMPEGNVSSYVDGAGGLRPHASSSGMVIIRADGTVGKVGGWLSAGHAVNPGDTIFVPEDVSSVGWTRLFRDWSQIFYQLGLGTAALKILKTGL